MTITKRPLTPEELKECSALKAIFTRFNKDRSKEERLTQEEFGALLGMNQGSISNVLNGLRPIHFKLAVKAASILGVPVEAFSPRLAAEFVESNSVIPLPTMAPERDRTFVLKPLDVPVGQMVRQIELSADALSYMRIKTDPKHLKLLEALNQSMSGSFNTGDTLLVDTSKNDPRPDAVFVLEINNSIFIRRVQHANGGGYTLAADNPSFVPMAITSELQGSCRFLGEVVWAWSSKHV